LRPRVFAGESYVVARSENSLASPPLTQPAVAAKAPVALPSALALVAKLRQYSWGGVLGLTATGAAGVLSASLREEPWLDIPLGLCCIGTGILLERVVNYAIGRDIDSRLEVANLRRDAYRRLQNLRDFQKQGLISPTEAHKLASGIVKRGVLGPPKPGRARGPYRKRQKPQEPVPDAPGAANSSSAQRPAA
jgi:hypothetical protein